MCSHFLKAFHIHIEFCLRCEVRMVKSGKYSSLRRGERHHKPLRESLVERVSQTPPRDEEMQVDFQIDENVGEVMDEVKELRDALQKSEERNIFLQHEIERLRAFAPIDLAYQAEDPRNAVWILPNNTMSECEKAYQNIVKTWLELSAKHTFNLCSSSSQEARGFSQVNGSVPDGYLRINIAPDHLSCLLRPTSAEINQIQQLNIILRMNEALQAYNPQPIQNPISHPVRKTSRSFPTCDDLKLVDNTARAAYDIVFRKYQKLSSKRYGENTETQLAVMFHRGESRDAMSEVISTVSLSTEGEDSLWGMIVKMKDDKQLSDDQFKTLSNYFAAKYIEKKKKQQLKTTSQPTENSNSE